MRTRNSCAAVSGDDSPIANSGFDRGEGGEEVISQESEYLPYPISTTPHWARGDQIFPRNWGIREPMKIKKSKACWSALACSLVAGGTLFVQSVQAATVRVDFDGYGVDVERVVGSGTNSAIITMDWTASGDSWDTPHHAWLVNWNDGELSTLGDALDLLADETLTDTVVFSYIKGSNAVLGDFQVTDGVDTHSGDPNYWASSWSTVDNGGTSATNSVGIQFWALLVGLTSAPLTDGEWYGINPDLTPSGSSSGNWPGGAPEVSAVAIPEPGLISLLLVGILTFTSRRRRL